MNSSKEHIVIAVPFTASEIEKLCELSLNHPHHFVRRKALAINLKSHGLSHAKIAEIIGDVKIHRAAIVKHIKKKVLNQLQQSILGSLKVS